MFFDFTSNYSMLNIPKYSPYNGFMDFSPMSIPMLPQAPLPSLDGPLFNFEPTGLKNIDLFDCSNRNNRKLTFEKYSSTKCSIENLDKMLQKNFSFVGDTPVQNNNISVLPNYNKVVAEKLSKDIKAHASGFKGHCAEFVSNALKREKLSNGQRGHAWQMKDILRENSKFKEIPISCIKDITSIPKGAVLVYDRGACGYSKTYGHIEIAIGGGKAASDGIQRIKGLPSALFVPA